MFSYLDQHPESSHIFSNAMSGSTKNSAHTLLQAYDFSRFEKIADIGGAFGSFLFAILKRYPQAKGILYDSSVVVAQAKHHHKNDLQDRVDFIGGSFFDQTPAGADAYILKHILHDWSDDECHQILSNFHKVMTKSAKMLIFERIVPADTAPHFSKLQDLEMMVSPGGRERTREEFDELLRRSGFQITQVIETNTPLSILEAMVK